MPDSQNVVELVDKFVRTDWTDLRDYPYMPSLAVLKRELLPAQNRLPYPVRDQGEGARCTGHALANLIDLQRRSVYRDPADPAADEMVSADMLYRMGAFHDDLPVIDTEALRDPSRRTGHFTDRPEGLRSLRSVLKGFYHHGVCLDMPFATSRAEAKRRWRSDCFVPDQLQAQVQVFPTVEQAKAARAIGLGAFYRLQPVLNDYHAALNDTGGILVSAQTHPGWLEPLGGRDEIGELKLDHLNGSHAFAIVGYTHEGFLVLNSWGERWGSGTRWPKGVALWRYSDWAKTVMDGWVLRLGVSAPDAFDLAAGEQGWKRTIGLSKAASPRSSQLLGHYLHLDDGFHVERGRFPSNATTWQVTRRYLRTIFAPKSDDDREGLLLWIPGSVEGLEDAARAALGRNAEARALKLYPYTFFWSHLFADKSIEVLTSVFASCLARVGSEGPQLDALIERELRGIGRAIWRDIELSAQRAVHGPDELPEEANGRKRRAPHGVLVAPFRDMLRLAGDTGCEIHVVTEGAGVLVLHELLRAQAGRQEAALDRITTLSLVHPAIDLLRASRHVVPLIERLNATDVGGAAGWPRARIYRASAALEARTCFDSYGGSLLTVLARAFEDLHQIGDEPLRDSAGNARLPTHPDNPPRKFLGMADVQPETARPGDLAFCMLTAVKDPRHATGKVPHHVLRDDPLIPKEIFSTIANRRTPSTECEGAASIPR